MGIPAQSAHEEGRTGAINAVIERLENEAGKIEYLRQRMQGRANQAYDAGQLRGIRLALSYLREEQ